MAHALLMDVHIRRAVAEGLRHKGIDVVTAQDINAEELDDASLLRCATELGRLLVTQDEDLLAIAREKQRRGEDFTGVIYAHQLSVGIGSMIADLELVCVCAEGHEVLNQVIYLPILRP